MIRSQKIRIYPNKQQEEFLIDLCKLSDYCYNRGLAIWDRMYKSGENPGMRKVRDYMKAHMKDFEYGKSPSVKDTALEDLDRAYKSFFRNLKKKKFYKPKFKLYNRKQSFRLYRKGPGSIRVRNGRFYPPNGGKTGIRLAEKLRFDGTIVTATVSKSITGKWYLSLVFKDAVLIKAKPSRAFQPHGGVGIDWGCTTFLTLSNGESFDLPAQYDKIFNKIKLLNQNLARTKLDSKRHINHRRKLSKAWENLNNFKTDYFNKLADNLASTYE